MHWPKLTPDLLTLHQCEQIALATVGNLGILGGGPGVGKTFTAAQLIKKVGEEIGFDQIAVAGPTGKSAVRITEVMNGYGIPVTARTIHSLLGVLSVDGGWSFNYCRTNPLPFKVIVIDESSMIDTDLAASLFAARPRDCMMLLLGDTGQLPPVGHGAPLRDMIAAGVPYGELREIKRQQSGDEVHAVIQACADIRDGKRFAFQRELVGVPCFSAETQIDEMFDTINRTSHAMQLNPVWDCQVLCAVNKKSELSRKELNKSLQARLNPNPSQYGSPFRLADKVVNTKNGWYPLVEYGDRRHSLDDLEPDPNLQLNDDGKCYVANGELGEVLVVEANYLHVRLTSPKRLIVVPRGQSDDDSDDEEGSTGTGCNWDLGYALSVHKSQGSEWPVVIIMVDDSGGAKRVCSREWLYTAISRAKRHCYLIGNLEAAQGFCRRTAIDKRKTFLKERIQQGVKGF